MKKDPLIKETLGEHIFNVFSDGKTKEWEEYEMEVHAWEIKKYLSIH